MYFENDFSNSLFTKGHRTITLGSVISGTILVLLGILIFVYPTLIAYFIATVILFVGLSILFLSWKLWKFRNEIANLGGLNDELFNFRSSGIRRSHITFVRW